MSLLDTITKTMLVKPHGAGLPFIAGGVIATLLFLLIWAPLGYCALILTAFTYYFFRDPIRAVPQQEGLVLSPADGRVLAVTPEVSLPDDLGEDIDREKKFTKISIFLSVFDVHVNRTPISGKVTKTFYYEGKFLNAELDKASSENERSLALIETAQGEVIGVGQIAGLVARRIITTLKTGEDVQAGERYGIIRFGSRADIYIPSRFGVLVCAGQRAIGGETVLANLNSTENTRQAKLI